VLSEVEGPDDRQPPPHTHAIFSEQIWQTPVAPQSRRIG